MTDGKGSMLDTGEEDPHAGTGLGGEPDPDAGTGIMGEKPKTRPIMIRGKEYQISADTDAGHIDMMFSLALIEMNDPKVDAVLRAYKLEILDADGAVIFK